MKSIFKQFDDIKKDLKDIQKTFQQELTESAEKDLIKAHDIIISKFYADYTPTSYHRHGIGGLYSTIISHKNTGKRASILIGSQDMEEHYRTDASNVFDLMWNKGVRGLPYIGSKPLTHSYNFYNHHFEQGDIWINPYWSGENNPYKNIFMPKISFGNYITNHGTPADIMEEFVNNWDKAYGLSHCEKIEKSFK